MCCALKLQVGTHANCPQKRSWMTSYDLASPQQDLPHDQANGHRVSLC